MRTDNANIRKQFLLWPCDAARFDRQWLHWIARRLAGCCLTGSHGLEVFWSQCFEGWWWWWWNHEVIWGGPCLCVCVILCPRRAQMSVALLGCPSGLQAEATAASISASSESHFMMILHVSDRKGTWLQMRTWWDENALLVCVRWWISSRPSLQARLASMWCTQSALQQLDSLSLSWCILFVYEWLWVKFRAVAICKCMLLCYIMLLCLILIYFACLFSHVFAVFAQFAVYGDK